MYHSNQHYFDYELDKNMDMCGAQICSVPKCVRLSVYLLCPPSKKEGHIALLLSVCWYVGLPQTCAIYNWRTPNPTDFKLGTLININIKMIPTTPQLIG